MYRLELWYITPTASDENPNFEFSCTAYYCTEHSGWVVCHPAFGRWRYRKNPSKPSDRLVVGTGFATDIFLNGIKFA